MAVRRLLALDPGERRTGVAVSDALGLYAHPRRAVHHTDRDSLVAAVERLVGDEGVDEVIVGLPLTLSGTESAQTRTTRELVGLLRQRLSVPVTPWDERLSTRQAERYVSGASRRRSGEQDSAAAALILQAVLDRRRGATIP